MLPAILELHLDYSAWASRELVKAASQLSAEELNLDFGTADGSILRTLVHVFAADRIWLARVTADNRRENAAGHGAAPQTYAAERDFDLAVLQTEWPALHQQWKAWAHTLTPESARQMLSYT